MATLTMPCRHGKCWVMSLRGGWDLGATWVQVSIEYVPSGHNDISTPVP